MPEEALGSLDPRPRRDVDLVGHETLRSRIEAAVRDDRFPPTLLLAGPEGVGKDRLAGWTARRLLCRHPGRELPCEGPSCRKARNLSHPDLHWYVPHTSPGSGSTDRQVASVEAQRAKRLARLREDALHPGPEAGETYYLATVQAIRRAVYRRPVEGSRKVFVITAAHELVRAGGGTSEAANAMLKLLEEPPAGTHFVLTSHAPDRLPMTVRSRAVELRAAPLSDREVSRVLRAALRNGPEDVDAAVAYGTGSPGRARSWWDETTRSRRRQAMGIVRALLSGDPRLRHELVEEQGFRGARKEFAAVLSEVERLCVAGGRHVVGLDRAPDDLAALLDKLPDRMRPKAEAWSRAAHHAIEAHREARANGNPKLILHALFVRAGREQAS